MKQLISIVFSFFTIGSAWAQSDYDFTQRWFNEFIYNPAAAGNSFTTSAFVHARQQWVGMDGAPSTQAASLDTYVESMNSGFGASFVSDRLGLISSHTIRLGYAYFIPIARSSVLSLGLSAGILNRSKRASDGIIENPSEPGLAYGNGSETSPDFDFGLEYKGPFKFGITVRHIGVQPSSSLFEKQSLNTWTYLSSRFNASGSMSVEPVVSYTYYSKISRLEGGVLLYFFKTQKRDTYNDRFWLGGMFRHNGDVALLAGIHLTPKIRLGYSFDYGVGKTASLSKFGSHELLLSFQFNRMFYKEPLCPAYRTGAITKNKRKR